MSAPDPPLLLRHPSSPHPSEKHDHRSDPVYASFQRKLCAGIIVTVIVLTVIVIATHHYGSSSDEPAPPPTPAFPPVPTGAYANSYYRVSVMAPSASANQTGFEWKRGGQRYGVFLDSDHNLSWRILLDYTRGVGVWQITRGADATCSALNGTANANGQPPQVNLLNATYVTDSATVDGVTCDQWTATEFVPNPPLGPTGDYRSVTYYQRRDTGYPARLTRAATQHHPFEDFYFYDFSVVEPPSSWFLPFACPQGLQPNPPAAARTEL